MSNTTQSPWTGTNIYANLLLLVGSLFGGISQDTTGLIVGAGVGVVGAFFAVRNWIVTAKFTTGKAWIAEPNNWAYLTAFITGLLPQAGALIPPLKSLAEAIVSGNWGAIITGVVALISLAYYTFFQKKV